MENSPTSSTIFCLIYKLSIEGKITYEEGVKLKSIINRALTLQKDSKIMSLIKHYEQNKNEQKLRENLIEIGKNCLNEPILIGKSLQAKKMIVHLLRNQAQKTMNCFQENGI